MLSYLEITKLCKCVDYQEGQFRVETWVSDTTEYKCVWLANNNSTLPTTIVSSAL